MCSPNYSTVKKALVVVLSIMLVIQATAVALFVFEDFTRKDEPQAAHEFNEHLRPPMLVACALTAAVYLLGLIATCMEHRNLTIVFGILLIVVSAICQFLMFNPWLLIGNFLIVVTTFHYVRMMKENARMLYA